MGHPLQPYDTFTGGVCVSAMVLETKLSLEARQVTGMTLLFLYRHTALAKDPTDIHSDNPLLILLVETCDAREQLVHLLDNLCNECPEFKQLVKVIVDCLNLDYRQRITAPIVHEKFSLLLQ